jgi:hypothetical protein
MVSDSRVGRGRGRASSSLGARGLGRGAFNNSVIDRSFGNESHLFRQADIESSVASPSELRESPVAPVRPLNLSYRKSTSEGERKKREKIDRQNARTPVDRGRMQAEAARGSFQQIKSRYGRKSLDIVAGIWALLRS